jgi:hypothetical protein
MLDSAKAAGAEVEEHFVEDLNINGCMGCYACWWRTPGKCVHRDDMDWILPKMIEANALILGTPVYHYNIRHSLQRLRERTLPLAMPEFDDSAGDSTHPARHSRSTHTIVVSVCGFPDQANFNQITGLFPAATKVYLPNSAVIFSPEGRELVKDFLDAVKKAGAELAEAGKVSEGTAKRLVVDYSPEVKKRLVERHNRMSSQITPRS